ncbi:CD27 antigen-like [Pempheris klunzingeri]|uniref:CD27 antigen-like n=1 Tax=Pempheris klunzingeri TaxID=3127111 RepID=UPI00397FAE46
MVDHPRLCCNMCPPGKRMVRRPDESCTIECDLCKGERYTDTYNVQMSCNHCENCNRTNMEYKSHCNATHNAVCRCVAGYRCKAQPCQECVPIPSTTTSKPTLLPYTTALTPETTKTLGGSTPSETPKHIKDTVSILVIIALLCAGIAFVVTKTKPFLRWIKYYSFAEKPAPVPQCCEDEDVSTPVQEVCGKCDQPIDV